MERVISAIGFLTIVAICFGLSKHRRSIRWSTAAWGFGLQIFFALIILKTPVGMKLFAFLNDIVLALLNCTKDGARFVFGNLVENDVLVGVRAVDGSFAQHGELIAQVGSFFAFTVLPTIIFFSSLIAVLYHLGIMQRVVGAVAWVMYRTMKTSGPETLSASANIFVGQTEAPLMVRPYIQKMTESELMAVMTAGFATVAGGVMAAYVAFLHTYIEGIAGHLMAASVMSAPASLALAKILVPETTQPSGGGESAAEALASVKKETINVIDAAASGATQGVKLSINIGAMLIAFLALLAVANGLLGWVGVWVGVEGLTLSWILGKLLSPFAFLLGVPWGDAAQIGNLLGTKIFINEFVAFLNLQQYAASGSISPRSLIIASYALCGFANFSSIAIQLGGLGGMAPDRRTDLARLGVRAMFAGVLASSCTACIAGIFL